MSDHDLNEVTGTLDQSMRTLVMLTGQAAELYMMRRAEQERVRAATERDAAAEARHERVRAERAAESALREQKDAAKMLYQPLMDDRKFASASREKVAVGFAAATAMQDRDPRAKVAVAWLADATRKRFGVDPEDILKRSPRDVPTMDPSIREIASPGARTGRRGSQKASKDQHLQKPEMASSEEHNRSKFAADMPATKAQHGYLKGAFGVEAPGFTAAEAHEMLSYLESRKFSDSNYVSGLTDERLADLWQLADRAGLDRNMFDPEVIKRMEKYLGESIEGKGSKGLYDLTGDLVSDRADHLDAPDSPAGRMEHSTGHDVAEVGSNSAEGTTNSSATKQAWGHSQKSFGTKAADGVETGVQKRSGNETTKQRSSKQRATRDQQKEDRSFER